MTGGHDLRVREVLEIVDCYRARGAIGDERLLTNDVDADVRNNIIFGTAGGAYMAICSGTGNTVLSDNWLPTGCEKFPIL